MNKKEVQQKIGKEQFNEFLEWMKGQTIGYNNGEEDFYEHDVLRFLSIQNSKPRKLKYKDIKVIKAKLIRDQKAICPICKRDLKMLRSRDLCLDHNHVTGKVRAVLCRSCNAIEGKLYKAFIRYGLRKAGIDYNKFVYALGDYVTYPETNYIHPKHKEKKVTK